MASLDPGAYLDRIGLSGEAAQDFTFVIRYEPRALRQPPKCLPARTARSRPPRRRQGNSTRSAYSFVYRGRANVYNDMRKFDFAIEDYNKAIGLAPQDGGLFIERGKIYRGQANFDQAIADFSHALEFDQKWTAAYRERGPTYKQLGQPAKALADLDIYNKIEPGDPTVVLALQDVSPSPAVNVPAPSTPKQEEPKASTKPSSSGTGFYIMTDGPVITNAHVVKRCSEFAVSAKAGEFSTGTTLVPDIANDLALLKTSERPEKVAALRLMPRLGEFEGTIRLPTRGHSCYVGKLLAWKYPRRFWSWRRWPLSTNLCARSAGKLWRTVAGSARQSGRDCFLKAERAELHVTERRRYSSECEFRYQGIGGRNFFAEQWCQVRVRGVGSAYGAADPC